MAINGTVKFFNTTKGFGFIQPDDGQKDAFVHVTALERAGIPSLVEGQKVSYDLEKGRDGKVSATNLRCAKFSARQRASNDELKKVVLDGAFFIAGIFEVRTPIPKLQPNCASE